MQMIIFREAALIAAAHTPLFSDTSGRKGYGERERYPYVFDAHAEAKKSSAFIGGAKVMQQLDYIQGRIMTGRLY